MLKHSFKKIIWLALFAVLFASFTHAQKPITDLQPTVILISIDGFRYDYLEKYQPKMLNKLAKEGTRAKWMKPSFPTKTFPNHYTIATGLLPAHHGIVENNIYDAEFDAVFGLGKREEVQNPRWWEGEPIWVTAEKQGQIAAAYFFPGTETAIKGVRPTFWKQYDGKIPNDERVKTVLSWFDQPLKKRPTIFTMYFSDVDDAGHSYSPDSKETKEAVKKVDSSIAKLYKGLKKRKIEKQVNLIIVSDHGMARVDPEKAIVLDEMFDTKLAEQVLWTGEIVQIFPKDGKADEIYNAIKAKLPANAKIYRKDEIPERFRYRDHRRIAPLIVLPDEGWRLFQREWLEKNKLKEDFNRPRGAHGYDNDLVSMRATFIAHGNAFKNRHLAEPFQNIEVYNLMCKILGLTPAKNDGNFENVKDLLR